jgi:hypothetical protein
MFLKDYTGKEAELLTDEQVQKIINFECADAGAPMLPERPEQPDKPNHKPDMQLYQVGGYYGWYVKTPEEAAKILEALRTVEIWDTDHAGSGYNHKKAKKKEFYEAQEKVEAVSVFSLELWDKVKAEMEAYDHKKKVYDKAIENYNKADKERNSISEWVWGVISDAREFKAKREELEAFKLNYLELAEHDKELGDKFFLKVYPDAGNWLGKYFQHEDLKTLKVVKEA